MGVQNCLFPEYSQEIEASSSPSDVWYEVERNLISAFKNSDEAFIKSVKQFFSWSVNTDDSSITYQSATCGFLEDLGSKKECWVYLNMLFSPQQFNMYKSTLGYSLSNAKLEEMENAFHRR